MKASRRFQFGLLIALLSAPAHHGIAQATWQTNGTPLSQATGHQGAAVMASDGAGGAITAWNDGRNESQDIYVQRIDGAGGVLWTADGVALCTADDVQVVGNVVPDGSGGAIVVWQDRRNESDLNIYVQRLSASGSPQWTADGVPVCSDPAGQQRPRCVSDGAGGAVITWIDLRNGDPDVYAQRVDASGTPQWTTDGVCVATWAWPNNQIDPELVSDGAGGAIIVWQDGRYYDYDIYAQRVDASGAAQWTANGVAICQASGHQDLPQIIPDGAGGAIMTWHDGRPGATAPDIYAGRIDGSGIPQWTTDGVALCLAAGDQRDMRIVGTASGAIIAWTDGRLGMGEEDVYAQCLNSSGTVQWSSTGAPFCTASGYQVLRAITGDGAGAIAIWADERGGIGTEDLYAQRLDGLGASQWEEDGVRVCGADDQQYVCCMVGDGAGGMIAAWEDRRSGLSEEDLYALRVYASGETPTTDVGDPADGLRLHLHNAPNPFVHGTTIEFELRQPRALALHIVDASGRRLRDLAIGTLMPGPQSIHWDGRDDEGRSLESGIYYVQLRTDGARQRQRLVRIR